MASKRSHVEIPLNLDEFAAQLEGGRPDLDKQALDRLRRLFRSHLQLALANLGPGQFLEVSLTLTTSVDREAVLQQRWADRLQQHGPTCRELQQRAVQHFRNALTKDIGQTDHQKPLRNLLIGPFHPSPGNTAWKCTAYDCLLLSRRKALDELRELRDPAVHPFPLAARHTWKPKCKSVESVLAAEARSSEARSSSQTSRSVQKVRSRPRSKSGHGVKPKSVGKSWIKKKPYYWVAHEMPDAEDQLQVWSPHARLEHVWAPRTPPSFESQLEAYKPPKSADLAGSSREKREKKGLHRRRKHKFVYKKRTPPSTEDQLEPFRFPTPPSTESQCETFSPRSPPVEPTQRDFSPRSKYENKELYMRAKDLMSFSDHNRATMSRSSQGLCGTSTSSSTVDTLLNTANEFPSVAVDEHPTIVRRKPMVKDAGLHHLRDDVTQRGDDDSDQEHKIKKTRVPRYYFTKELEELQRISDNIDLDSVSPDTANPSQPTPRSPKS